MGRIGTSFFRFTASFQQGVWAEAGFLHCSPPFLVLLFGIIRRKRRWLETNALHQICLTQSFSRYRLTGLACGTGLGDGQIPDLCTLIRFGRRGPVLVGAAVYAQYCSSDLLYRLADGL